MPKGKKVEQNLPSMTVVFIVAGDDHHPAVALGLNKKSKTAFTNVPEPPENGFGGKVLSGEHPTACAVRELREEAGLTIRKEDLEHVASITVWQMPAKKGVLLYVYRLCYKKEFSITLFGQEFASIRWCPQTELYHSRLVPSDRAWVPIVLAQKKGSHYTGTIYVTETFEVYFDPESDKHEWSFSKTESPL